MASLFQSVFDPPAFHALPFKEMQKRRLFNRANITGSFFCLAFCIVGLLTGLSWLVYLTIFNAVALFIATYLNMAGSFNIARHISFNASLVLFVGSNYFYGSTPHTEIYLFSFSGVVIFIFDSRKTVLLYCTYLLALFILCIYMQTHFTPNTTVDTSRFAYFSYLNYVFAFAGLAAILYSFKVENLDNSQKIEAQKQIIEEKNKDLLDSITYAKRLQDALLPPISEIKKHFPECFVLYKPKDIVAGDFYWFEKVGDTILIAACDCTGHGVPGAMVSVVCSNALNRAVKEFKITEPGKILDKVRELVLESFEKSESEVKDGMDISLCNINLLTHKILWSGAYNPLWYIQNGALNELPPNKQPIGKQEGAKPFSTRALSLQKGDTLYLFTDGYADQFGGPKGKKFKYKQLQDNLLAMSALSMDAQHKLLEQTIETWKSGLDQVDDVLIMGIRI